MRTTEGQVRSRRARGVLLAGAVLAAAACGGGGGYGDGASPPTAPTSTTPTSGGSASGSTAAPVAGTAVTVGNNSFTPANLAVAVGGTVTWTWDSCANDPYGSRDACVSHDVTFDQGGGGSPVQSSGAFSRTFTTPGTYAYHCSIHGSSMSGQVVVR